MINITGTKQMDMFADLLNAM